MVQPAGRRDRRITIEVNTPTRNSVGEEVESWSTFATVWAEKRDIRGQEFFEGRRGDNIQERAEVDTRWRILWLAGVKAKMRISYDGVLHDIEAVMEIGRREGVEIMTKSRID